MYARLCNGPPFKGHTLREDTHTKKDTNLSSKYHKRISCSLSPKVPSLIRTELLGRRGVLFLFFFGGGGGDYYNTVLQLTLFPFTYLFYGRAHVVFRVTLIQVARRVLASFASVALGSHTIHSNGQTGVSLP